MKAVKKNGEVGGKEHWVELTTNTQIVEKWEKKDELHFFFFNCLYNKNELSLCM